MKAITVKELLEALNEEVKKGNGDKQIYLANDDEGNGFHAMYYTVTSDPIEVEGCLMYNREVEDSSKFVIVG